MAEPMTRAQLRVELMGYERQLKHALAENARLAAERDRFDHLAGQEASRGDMLLYEVARLIEEVARLRLVVEAAKKARAFDPPGYGTPHDWYEATLALYAAVDAYEAACTEPSQC